MEQEELRKQAEKGIIPTLLNAICTACNINSEEKREEVHANLLALSEDELVEVIKQNLILSTEILNHNTTIRTMKQKLLDLTKGEQKQEPNASGSVPDGKTIEKKVS